MPVKRINADTWTAWVTKKGVRVDLGLFDGLFEAEAACAEAKAKPIPPKPKGCIRRLDYMPGHPDAPWVVTGYAGKKLIEVYYFKTEDEACARAQVERKAR